jgi:spoIIIJ-associated protein
MDIVDHVQQLFALMGFNEVEVNVDEDVRKISIVIDDEFFRSQIPTILQPVEHLINLGLKRGEKPPYVVDMNYYRRERERLIIELAKAGAKKAKMSKGEVSLPPMNSYERRLVHVEIASNPDLKTESVGVGKERHIVIIPIEN